MGKTKINYGMFFLLPMLFLFLSCEKSSDHQPVDLKPVNLIFPSNNSVISSEVQFKWENIQDAIAYHIQVDDDSSFSSPIVNNDTLRVPYYTTSLQVGDYYWRARAMGLDGVWSDWSSVWSFKVILQPFRLKKGVKALMFDGKPLQLNEETNALSVRVTDWNNDGKKDLLIGTYYPAYIYVFLNIANNEMPRFSPGQILITQEGDTISVNMGAAPVPTDWNSDGKKDLLIGSMGHIEVYFNIGSDSTPLFSNAEQVYVDFQRYQFTYYQPFIIDYDLDGKKDMIIGSSGARDNAYVACYLNIGDDASPQFNLYFYLQIDGSDINETYSSCIYIVNLNSESSKDLVVRHDDGFYWAENIGSDEVKVFSNKLPVLLEDNIHLQVENGRNFEVTDFDEDGFIDFIVGDYDGYVWFFMGY